MAFNNARNKIVDGFHLLHMGGGGMDQTTVDAKLPAAFQKGVNGAVFTHRDIVIASDIRDGLLRNFVRENMSMNITNFIFLIQKASLSFY